MNREILFRGKCVGSGEWVEGYFAQSTDTFIIQDCGLHAGNFQMIKVIPETVGQFTGFTDKNGRKIFEGDVLEFTDVLKFTNRIEEIDEIFAVLWHSTVSYDLENTWIEVGFHSKPRQPRKLDEFGSERSEIIGNIHDNPDFLKALSQSLIDE